MDLTQLRKQTAGDHAATEDAVPLMNPGLTRAGYVDMLKRFYRVVSAWDRWVDAHAPQDLLPLLQGRRRATLLASDLEAMGSPLTEGTEVYPPFVLGDSCTAGDVRSVFLGRLYVMEGSTLGGQYIAQHAEETLGLASGAGDSYFRGYGEATGDRWREVRTVLQALPDTELDTVVASAREMFTLFGAAMREAQQVQVAGTLEDAWPEAAPNR